MSQTATRRCLEEDFDSVLSIINDGARAYEGHIPPDRLHDPYMSRTELMQEIADGVEFWGFSDGNDLVAVMGMQHVQDVVLVRHAYVRRNSQNKGLGGRMIRHLCALTSKPMLVGTWADAFWAIRFYQRHDFHEVGQSEKDYLLRRYWNVPDRQIETSIVLADERWLNRQSTV